MCLQKWWRASVQNIETSWKLWRNHMLSAAKQLTAVPIIYKKLHWNSLYTSKEERAQKAHLKADPAALVSLARMTAHAPVPLFCSPFFSSAEGKEPPLLVKGDIYLGNSSRNLRIKTSLKEFYTSPCTLIHLLSKIFLKIFSDNDSKWPL